jgi:signal transduction histidine kinase
MTWRAHRRHYGRRGPPPFVRRMGCAFAALVVFAAIGATTLVSMFFRAPRSAALIAAIAFGVGAVLVIGFALAIRRVSRVFGEQDRLRRQLMADVAHELRTPLAILQGRVEGLIDGVYPPDAARLGELLDETRHLSRLVEDLGTLASAEAGALEAAASIAPSIDVRIAGELPLMEIDPVRIREVLLNLLSNAVRHTPAGGAVSIAAAAEGRRLVIRVTDSGSGIPADELPRIFTRFQKGRDSPGSGLGLAIAQKLVQAHGGEIRVESTVGKGTTATVWLPL